MATAGQGMEDITALRVIDARLATAGQPSEEQLRAVAAAGYEVVINLALHDQRYSLPDEAGLTASLGMRYVHIPVRFEHPTADDLRRFFAAMDEHASRRVFVHCAANMRVSAFLGLYRVLRLGWDEDRAFALMRGIWEPDAVWREFLDQALRRGPGSG